jgi:AraC-like DNA-binding protein
MIKRTKHKPLNAASALPTPLVTALQQVAAGQYIYIPAIESPTSRRWRDARQYQQLGYSPTDIAKYLKIEPRTVKRLLASPPPPYTHAAAAHFTTPKTQELLRRIQQHVQAGVLYVPVAVSKVEKRQQRIQHLLTLGWIPARVATHLKMNARYVNRLFQAWKSLKESEGITVVLGQPLYSVKDKQRNAVERDRKQRERIAKQQRQIEQARQRAICSDEMVTIPKVRILPLDKTGEG